MEDSLSASAAKILGDAFDVQGLTVDWVRPPVAEHGDLATPVALKIAKEINKKPNEIAVVLADKLAAHPDIEKVEVAGPGYVNIWLTPEALIGSLSRTRKACAPALARKEAPVIVEYSQPNIAKPLGVHHLISTLVGQSLANIYRHQGFSTISVNHLGDWGTQFGKLAVAIEKWGSKPIKECTLDDLLELYVRFHEEAVTNAALEDEARAAFRAMEDGDKKLLSFWHDVVDITMKEINAIYERLHVRFDHVQGESFYEDKMKPILEEGKKKNVFVEGEKGALIVEFAEESGLPPAVVLKGDGATIYLTRDLATIDYRMNTWHPQAVLYVVDVAQSLYFQQLFATVGQLEWKLPHLEHVVIGRMRFVDKSMSTRKGNILRLREFLDEAVRRSADVIAARGDQIQTDDSAGLAEVMGHGAVAYGILSQNRKQEMIFDWDKMLSFEGNSAPYLQYTHARAKSVLRKAGDARLESVPVSETLQLKERVLIRRLLDFPMALTEARENHMPHMLANYLYALSQEFNAFYNEVPILKAEEPARSLRLSLTDLTAHVLKTGAELLTLRVPEHM